MTPPAWCIYCEELPRRQEATATHLASRGIRPTWWRGFHGATWGLATTKEAWPGYRMSAGHVGLVLSHYALWQHLWHLGAEEALILEDDVLLPEDFAGRLAGVLRAAPPAWQFLWLGLVGMTPDKVRDELPGGLARCVEPYGTHCYLVRRSALPVLLAGSAEARAHVDIQVYQNTLAPGLLEWYACVPSLAGQRSYEGEWERAV